MKNLLLLLAILANGCTFTTEPARFYLLAPEAEEKIASDTGLSLGIGPIKVAEYLQQAPIVTKGYAFEYIPHEFHRWAEPLQDNIRNVMRENLAQRLNTKHVTDYPWIGEAPEYQVVIDVSRFHCSNDRRCILLAYWSIENLRRKNGAARKRTMIEETAALPDFEGVAATMSSLLGRLSQEIAAALQER